MAVVVVVATVLSVSYMVTILSHAQTVTGTGNISSTALTYEAENMAKVNYMRDTYYPNYVVLTADGATGSLSTNFSGGTGTYNIRVHVMLETDGQSTQNFYKDGAQIYSYKYPLGADTETYYDILNVSLNDNSALKLTSIGDAGSRARVDKIVFTPTSASSGTVSGAVPAIPANLTATSGDGTAGLNWTASTGALSYTVKRSTTSGGPYTTIVSGFTSTSYSNTGLANGTTYYYVVSAVNVYGASANSAQVSAIPVAPIVTITPVPTTTSSPTPVLIVSPRGTSVPSAPYIIDTHLSIWTLKEGVAYLNGSAVIGDTNTIKLYWDGSVVYKENSAAEWSWWNGIDWTRAGVFNVGEPYTGTATAFPGTVEAENFDKNGEGFGYHDLSVGNSGGTYRTGENVDIILFADTTGSGYAVTNFQTYEWLNYTVNVKDGGMYDFSFRVANAGSQAGIYVEMYSTDITGPVTIPYTGSGNFQWVTKTDIELKPGKYVMKVVAIKQYFDLDSIKVTASVKKTATTTITTTAATETTTVSSPITAPSATVDTTNMTNSTGYTPAAPTNLRLNGMPTATQIPLLWNDNSNNEDRFEIERKLSGDVSYGGMVKLSGNITAYIDTTVAAGKSYDYRTRACLSGFGCSTYTYLKSVSAPAVDTAASNTLTSDNIVTTTPLSASTITTTAQYSKYCDDPGHWFECRTLVEMVVASQTVVPVIPLVNPEKFVALQTAGEMLPGGVSDPEELQLSCSRTQYATICSDILVKTGAADEKTAVSIAQQVLSLQLQNEKIFAERFGARMFLDTDKDGIVDYDELNIYRTLPKIADTNGDKISDGAQILLGEDPLAKVPKQEPKATTAAFERKIIYQDPRFAGDIKPDLLEVTAVAVVPAAIPDENATATMRLRFHGKALPNSFVTLFIYSEPIVVTIKADASGTWTYTLDKELADGKHEIYTAVTDSSGRILAKSTPLPFVKEAGAVTFGSLDLLPSNDKAPGFFSGASLYAFIALLVGVLGLVILLIGIVTRRNSGVAASGTSAPDQPN
ncbi:MAG: hypothetical protein A2942_03895 [Candidatus Lloydbacteria bacterium RIFCSPLOWO2_01_FULL_50_20]|uniref:Fibronectin type-III domain-containing protein n=1 Tax=Candidatus Lloydbacteria bacterium RIFCSPLOWO2_01_FULL_50_20 TaxID=1798665 RepID=A0A1G2DF40_9BACT|nr:MAG: hypothetical protein A2942_03895 [Candidatus Lloydbacteria bacterium RIFCSPLOWO2_01_FULL_50_20]